jgi:uncharacterized protein (TIGR03435 family)
MATPRLRAQPQPETFDKPSGPKFEVASIKPAPDFATALQTGHYVGFKSDGAQATFGGATLQGLIRQAYRLLRPYQLSGPSWLDSGRWDILAKLPEGATADQVPEMLRWLLAERFGLVAHEETKDLPGFALVVGKDGPKMKPAKPDPRVDPTSKDVGNHMSRTGDGMTATMPNTPGGKTTITASNGVLHIEAAEEPMSQLAKMLEAYTGGPVLNMTGLEGKYEVAVDFSLADTMSAAKANAPGGADGPTMSAEPSGSSLFSAIQRLGLRLERRKVPVEILVVDHLDRVPKEN